jgi:hypothetical protein
MPRKITKILSLFLCFCLILGQSAFAQSVVALDISSRIASLHSTLTIEKFRPLHLRYLQFDPAQNNFNLLIDKGTLKNPSKREIEHASKDLMKYFFIGLSLSNDKFWVNLRPDSPDNIIDPFLEETDIGKILLEADVELKKDTALATSPETPEGKAYWDKLYKKAAEIFGTDNVTIPTLTRPWIVPGEIIIRETEDSAYIYKATLKVMLEEDYIKNNETYKFNDPRSKVLNEYSSQLIRELIIPKLTREVNSTKKYASLRQVYYSLILARWFKERFAYKQTLYSGVIESRNLTGLTAKTQFSKDAYFQAYQKSFKDGEYNIQSPAYTPYGQSIRSYFSGGITGLAPKIMPGLGSSPIVDPNTGAKLSSFPANTMTAALLAKGNRFLAAVSVSVILSGNSYKPQFNIAVQETPPAAIYSNPKPKTQLIKEINDYKHEIYVPTSQKTTGVASSPAKGETKLRSVKEVFDILSENLNENDYWFLTVEESDLIPALAAIREEKAKKILVVGSGLKYLALASAVMGIEVGFVDRDPQVAADMKKWAEQLKSYILKTPFILAANIDAIQESAVRDNSQSFIQPDSFDMIFLLSLVGSKFQGDVHRAIQNSYNLIKPQGVFYLPNQPTKTKEGPLVTMLDALLRISPDCSIDTYLPVLVTSYDRMDIINGSFNSVNNPYRVGKSVQAYTFHEKDSRVLPTVASSPKVSSPAENSLRSQMFREHAQYFNEYGVAITTEGRKIALDLYQEAIDRFISLVRQLKEVGGVKVSIDVVALGGSLSQGGGRLGIFPRSITFEDASDAVINEKVFAKQGESLGVNPLLLPSDVDIEISYRGDIPFAESWKIDSAVKEKCSRQVFEEFGVYIQSGHFIRLSPSVPIRSIENDGLKRLFTNGMVERARDRITSSPVIVEYPLVFPIAPAVLLDEARKAAEIFLPIEDNQCAIATEHISGKLEEREIIEQKERRLYLPKDAGRPMKEGDSLVSHIILEVSFENEAWVIDTQLEQFTGVRNNLDLPEEFIRQYVYPAEKYYEIVPAYADNLGFKGIKRTALQITEQAASPVKARSGFQQEKGGIDFRQLPIVTQAIGSLSVNMSRSSLNSISSVNLNKEWQEIERMVFAGIKPSSQRIKEYIQVSCIKGDINVERVLNCVSEVLRQEEEICCQTDKTLQDILVVLDSARSEQELKEVFIGS